MIRSWTARFLIALPPILGAALPQAGAADDASSRPRARALGLQIGVMAPGPRNDITDVAGVRVGHYTLRQEPRFNTGITAILPHGGNLYLEKVPAAVVVGNGFGKLAGSTQVNELGEAETPILLTGTLNLPRVADGLITYMLSLPGMEEVRSINPVVGETNDGYLSDIRARPLGENEVRAAIQAAGTGPVSMGAVGAGTGTVCFGFKGGIGSASRRLADSEGGWTVGVLVQSNFGGPLRIGGLPLRVGESPLGDFLMRSARGEPTPPGGMAGGSVSAEAPPAASGNAHGLTEQEAAPPAQDGGSLMIVVATDAPLDHRNLGRLAARSLYGMALTGGYGANGSGDYAIAFTTHEKLRIRKGDPASVVSRPTLGNEASSRLFLAATEAAEEAIVDSLFTARAARGLLGSVPELPVDEVLELAGIGPSP